MKTPLPFLLVVQIFCCTSLLAQEKFDPNDYTSSHSCYLLGKKYFFGVTDEHYKKMSAWNIQSEDSPPVSPQKAYALSKERLDKIEIASGYSWVFQSVALKPVNTFFPDGPWIWMVTFEYRKDGFSSGIPSHMSFLVSMKGELIEPIVTTPQN